MSAPPHRRAGHTALPAPKQRSRPPTTHPRHACATSGRTHATRLLHFPQRPAGPDSLLKGANPAPHRPDNTCRLDSRPAPGPAHARCKSKNRIAGRREVGPSGPLSHRLRLAHADGIDTEETTRPRAGCQPILASPPPAIPDFSGAGVPGAAPVSGGFGTSSCSIARRAAPTQMKVSATLKIGKLMQ